MNDYKNSIILKNIIKCSADVQHDTAELDLLINEFVFDYNFNHKSLSNIKNELKQKFALLDAKLNTTKNKDLQRKLNVCKQLPKYTEINFNFLFKPKFINSANIIHWCYNDYENAAFIEFSKLFSSCDEIRAENFNNVCENIISDKTFGIVPIMNSNDGRLMSFYRLLDKYDLKISSTCDVENLNGDNITTFALVGKDFIKTDLKNLSILNFQL